MAASKTKKKTKKAVCSCPSVPPELSEAISGGKCAVFIGAGLSSAAGYPSWKVLLNKLIKKATNRYNTNATQAKELNNLLADNDNLLMVAEELRERFGRDIFNKELVTIFDKDLAPTKTHLKLMDIPFEFAITTNYDQLLERAYLKKHGKWPAAYPNSQPPEIADALWRGDYFILKAHGDVINRMSLVLTEKDYREIINHRHGYRAALSSIFTTKTILFLGVSFADPEFKLLLGYLHDAFHGGRTHFALVPSTEFSESIVNRWRKDYSIECLCYKPTKGHPEVYKFVQSLPTK